MTERITPPTLLSRLLIFVFAAILVVFVTLIFTISKIFPLNRSQVYFLTAQPRQEIDINLSQLVTTEHDIALKKYIPAWIREYVKVRNEISPNITNMRKKWGVSPTGYVYTWSSAEEYSNFMSKKFPQYVMTNRTLRVDYECVVNFDKSAVIPRTTDYRTFAVNFSHICYNTNNPEQIFEKNYQAIITIEFDNEKAVRWVETIENPLGIKVIDYKIESIDNLPASTDPLDTVL